MGKYSAMYDPETPVLQPKEFLDNAKSIIVIGGNGYFKSPELPGNPPRGLFMNFFVNPDLLAYAASTSDKITTFLSEQQLLSIERAKEAAIVRAEQTVKSLENEFTATQFATAAATIALDVENKRIESNILLAQGIDNTTDSTENIDDTCDLLVLPRYFGQD